ncbi:coatomer WD associated region-domain-containing protein [Mycena galopus ATCC 62051]|nr:coatomer WD associated region-domain-containing protein [Mycena galopus ATCC 62051]
MSLRGYCTCVDCDMNGGIVTLERPKPSIETQHSISPAPSSSSTFEPVHRTGSLESNPFHRTERNANMKLDSMPRFQSQPARFSFPKYAMHHTSAIFVARNRFSVLQKVTQIIEVRDLANSVVKTIKSPVQTNEIFYGGTASLILSSTTSVVLYDIRQQKTLAEVNSPPVKYVVWSNDGSLVALMNKYTITIANKNFSQHSLIHETIRIKSGAWDDSGVFIYSTLNHVKCCLSQGDHGVICTLDNPWQDHALSRPVGAPADDHVRPNGVPLQARAALYIIRTSTLLGQSIIAYLQQKGFPEIALHFVQDTSTRFELAPECGNLEHADCGCHVINGGFVIDSVMRLIVRFPCRRSSCEPRCSIYGSLDPAPGRHRDRAFTACEGPARGSFSCQSTKRIEDAATFDDLASVFGDVLQLTEGNKAISVEFGKVPRAIQERLKSAFIRESRRTRTSLAIAVGLSLALPTPPCVRPALLETQGRIDPSLIVSSIFGLGLGLRWGFTGREFGRRLGGKGWEQHVLPGHPLLIFALGSRSLVNHLTIVRESETTTSFSSLLLQSVSPALKHLSEQSAAQHKAIASLAKELENVKPHASYAAALTSAVAALPSRATPSKAKPPPLPSPAEERLLIRFDGDKQNSSSIFIVPASKADVDTLTREWSCWSPGTFPGARIATSTTEFNWPAISTGRNFFDRALANGSLETGVKPAYINGDAAAAGASSALDTWTKDEEIHVDDLDPEEGGWELDADADLPGSTPGVSEVEHWVHNSALAADHIFAGSFETAMQLLNCQLGIVNFVDLKPLFLSIYRSSHTYVASLPPLHLHIRRNPAETSLGRCLPVVVRSLASVRVVGLAEGFRSVSSAPFCMLFYWCLCPQTEDLVTLGREYLACPSSLSAGELRKKNRVHRNLELAAYFTQCKLQPPHAQIVLRCAVNVFTKANNRRTQPATDRGRRPQPPKRRHGTALRALRRYTKDLLAVHDLYTNQAYLPEFKGAQPARAARGDWDRSVGLACAVVRFACIDMD